MPAVAHSSTNALAWVLLALAGGLGTVARFAVQLGARNVLGDDWPHGTLAVNALGCFAIGLIATLLEGRGLLGVDLRTLVGTGFLGGFTTYSAFNLETLQLGAQGQWAKGGAYLLATVVLCLGAGVAGLGLGRGLAR